MNVMNYLAGGAALGLVAGFWNYIKTALWRVANLFVHRVEVPGDAAHEALVSHLVTHFKRSLNYDRMYGAGYEHHRDGRYGLVPYELFGHRTILFWNGWLPFLFSNEQENKAKGGQQQPPPGTPGTGLKVCSTLTFVRGTLDVEQLLRDACARRNELSWSAASEAEDGKSRFAIYHLPPREDADGDDDGGGYGGLPWFRQASYRLLAHDPNELGKAPLHDGNALKSLVFPRRVTHLIREIELWRQSRDWYRSRGIPWKRGWLLYGPPGTGKTALARAFAEDLNMPIYVFNLAAMDNHALLKAWSALQVNVPCVALFEDIDNVFHGRENVSRRNAPSLYLPPPPPANGQHGQDGDRARFGATLTFDCLLNCLDGVERSDGVFTVITTNDITKIDPALGQPRTLPDGTLEFISTRPGRIDKAVELTYLEPVDKRRMARRILGDYPEALRRTLAFIDEFPDLQETPAQFQERCSQAALRCFWEEKEALIAREQVPEPEGVPAE